MIRQRPPNSKIKETPPQTSTISGTSSPRRSSRLSSAAAASTSSTMEVDDPRTPMLGSAKHRRPTSLFEPQSSSSDDARPPVSEDEMPDLQNKSKKPQWIILAVASGCCAAFNGVFAKLTTTELTTSFATSIAGLIGLAKVEKGVEVVVRAIFFGLNLIFNGVMWALFTKALARGTSTTQVSIINTSSNFMITAILGFIIFSESLPPLWWLGAALLVAGNVIIGRREEEEVKKPGEDVQESGGGRYSNEEQEGLLVGESVELNEDLEERKRRQAEEDVLHLGSDDEDAKSDEELISTVR